MRLGNVVAGPRRRGAVVMALVASLMTATGVAAQQGAVPATVTLFPGSDSAQTGTCAEYTVTVTDQNGQPVQGVTVHVHQGKRDPMLEPHSTVELSFCEPAPGHTRNPTGQGTTAIREVVGNNPSETPDQPGRNTSVRAEIGPTDANGDVTFGIEINGGGGGVFLTAWVDVNPNDRLELEEPSDGSFHHWVSEAPVIDAEPEFATVQNGTLQSVTVYVTMQGGGQLSGVTPRSVILPDSGGQAAGDVSDPAAGPSPNATVRGAPAYAYSCTTSNSHGISTCTFQDPVSTPTGTDTIVFFWDRGGEARWPDGSDPRDAVQKTWVTPTTPTPAPTPTATPIPTPTPTPTPTPSQSPSPSPTPTPPATQARNVHLCQGSSAVPCDMSPHWRSAGDVHELAALVTDANGLPVANVPVDLRETGPARFVATGTSSVLVTTGNDGVARASIASDDEGESTIVAEMSPPGSPGSFRGPGPADDECELPGGNCVTQALTVTWEEEVVNGHDCDDGIDNDGDAYIDFPDDPGCENDSDGTEEPFDKPPRRVPHSRTISLHFTDLEGGERLSVSGRVRLAETDDDYRPCVRNMDVRIERLVDGAWVEKARDYTNHRGRYSGTVRDVTGRYRAVATSIAFQDGGLLHDCLRAKNVKTHRHRE
nr:hypothetical protein [uncultured bacterium]